MALILPPDADYDSFVSVADATTYINALTLDGATWSAENTTTQETYLRIATRKIVDGINEDIYVLDINNIPECVPEATALMAVHDLVTGISVGTSRDDLGAVKKEQVGSIVKEYYDTKSKFDTYVALVPALARPCLESIGYEFPSGLNGVRQTTLGRS